MNTPSAREQAPRCEQTLRGWTPSWEAKPECGQRARFTWRSNLRGIMKLCRRHAKAAGIENCKELPK